jgi:hypothetical protein
MRSPTIPAAGCLSLSVAALLLAGPASRPALAYPPKPEATPTEGLLSLVVDIGPVAGAPNTSKTLTFNPASRRRTVWYDVQDGLEHHVRGVTLADLLLAAHAGKAVDAVVFDFADGMKIPVHLGDAEEVNAIFIALEHGDPMDVYGSQYLLHNRAAIPCPKIVYGREPKDYSIWLYPTKLVHISLVSWKAFETNLAQPTRQFPDRSGWPIYLRHCQACHGLGGQGARRGPDFLSDMDAYRRVPPLAVTDLSEHPSLHEKVKGFTDGTMPVLNQVSNQENATLWRWLHLIHKGATK